MRLPPRFAVVVLALTASAAVAAPVPLAAAATGRLVAPAAVVDPPAPREARRAEAAAATPQTVPAGVDVDDLHSDAGSSRTLLIDLDGATVAGTLWNQAPYLLPDGGYGGWSPAGRDALVYEIWQRVAEDYAPFDVDVTTDDPGAAGIDRDGAADTTFGTRVLVTTSNLAQSKVCGGVACGGIAYQDAFDDDTQHSAMQPAWVFAQSLGTTNARFIAEAVSHEAGHTFGLVHDDVSTSGGQTYYQGEHQSPEGWAPNMGSAYGQPVTQWSRAAYTGAVQGEPGGPTQPSSDDIAVIAAHGAPLRADEDGGTLATAAPLSSAPAYITTSTDVDYVRLGACSGPVTVRADPAAVGADLDVRLDLLDATGASLDHDDEPFARTDAATATGLGAAVSVTVPAAGGTYYAEVQGVGMLGHASATTGYDDYGSVGAYTLQVTGCHVPGTPTLPVGLTASLSGTSATLTWTAPAGGGSATGVTGYRVYRDGALAASPTGTSWTATGLPRGVSTRFSVRAVAGSVEGDAASVAVAVPAVRSSAPRLGSTTAGAWGGPVTAAVRWSPPVDAGGAAVDGYRVVVTVVGAHGHTVTTAQTAVLDARYRSVTVTFQKPVTARFAVRAHTRVGWSPPSATSKRVAAR